MREFSRPAEIVIRENDNNVNIIFEHAKESPDLVLLARWQNEDWVDVTAQEFLAQVIAVAKGFIAKGIQPGDRINILSPTSYEWTLLDFAIWAAAAVSVPIYDSSSPGQIHWIVSDSGSKIIVAARREIETVFTEQKHQLTDILAIEDGAIESLIEAGKDLPDSVVYERVANLKADDIATLVYTSGTTGKPKGCILSHRNFLFEVAALANNPVGHVGRPGNRNLAFLPLAHVLSRAAALAMIYTGTTMAHWSDLSTMSEQMRRFRPNSLMAVPRLFEKVREAAAQQAIEKGKLAFRIFLFAERTAVQYSRMQDEPNGPSRWVKIKMAIANKVVLNKIREAMGGQMWWTLSGGSALSMKLAHFFRGIDIPVYEGWGMTETAAAYTVNAPGEQKIGTVGMPLAGNAVRIADDDEVQLKGPLVFQGYWQNPQATKEAFTEDGWFHTGDLGTLDDDGYLTITGRKKDLIITTGGKNIAPEPLEESIRTHDLVSQAVLVGDGRPFVAALIALDSPALDRWKVVNNKPKRCSAKDLAGDPDLRHQIQSAIDDANASVSHAEQVKKFAILAQDLTEIDGDLTPTAKVKRHVISAKYADVIDGLYRRN